MYDINVYPQVVKAYRMILRHIRASGFHAGDLITSQPELCQMLNFSNDTLSKAMKCLVDDGVLERRKRVGTMLLDMSKARLSEHVVVLATVPHTTLPREPYYGHLLCALEGYIREFLGAKIHIVIHQKDPQLSTPWPVSTFPELEALVQNGEADAVICPIGVSTLDVERFKKIGVPWLHVGSDEGVEFGSVIDQEKMVDQACQMMSTRGCKQIAMVCRKTDKNDDVSQLRFMHAYKRASIDYGFKTMKLVVADDISLEDGREVARHLLKVPEGRRPDGLIVINDMLTAGMTDVFRDESSYQPHIAVQANIPGSLIFGVPVIRFDVDVYELARLVVEQLRKAWQQFDAESLRHDYVPHLAHENARDMQISALV
jgi:DNA-binding LacI/PurR family transcriptional regulator